MEQLFTEGIEHYREYTNWERFSMVVTKCDGSKFPRHVVTVKDFLNIIVPRYRIHIMDEHGQVLLENCYGSDSKLSFGQVLF